MYCQASSLEYRLGAFKLIYTAYITAGLCDVNEYELRVIKHQLLSTSQIFVHVQDDKIISTVTYVGDSINLLPMDTVFHEEIANLRLSGQTPAEISCLATKGNHSGFLSSFRGLTKLMAQYARLQGTTCFVIVVHPRHSLFYERYFGFKTLSNEIKPYKGVKENLAMSLILDLNAIDKDKPWYWEEYFGDKTDLQPYIIPKEELDFWSKICQE